MSLPDYAELHCLSSFSFLRGASHPEELVEQAMAQGYAIRDAARVLAGHPGSLSAVKETLAQVNHSGAPVVPQWDALWSKPGMYLSPYIIALRCWIAWGFLFDGAR